MAYYRSQNRKQRAPMNPRHLPFALFLAAFLALSGCGTINKEKKSTAMDAALTTYGEAIRWAYWDTAYGYIHPDKRKAAPEYLDNVRVTNYDVVQPPVMRSDEELEQVARIEYVHKDTQRVRTLSDRQIWSYDEESNAWWLQSGVPQFGYRKR